MSFCFFNIFYISKFILIFLDPKPGRKRQIDRGSRGRPYLLRNCSRPCLLSSMKESSNIPSSPRNGSCRARAFPGSGGTTTWGQGTNKTSLEVEHRGNTAFQPAQIYIFDIFIRNNTLQWIVNGGIDRTASFFNIYIQQLDLMTICPLLETAWRGGRCVFTDT